MKFIHLGDAHLGAEPESGTSLGPVRKKEIWDAFQRVLSVCNEEKIDLLLIPGDLFHGQPLLRDVKEVAYLFGTLTHTKVVMIAGNHDCLLPESHYYDVELPQNVTFLRSTQGDSVYFPEYNTEVFGASYETKQIAESRYDAIKINIKTRINILIAHGNINCTDKSIPIHRAAIEQNGFDYAALGHLHTRFDISNRIAYSGGFEPFERKETGPKGYIAGEIQKEETADSILSWRFVPNARREYVNLHVEITPETTELSLCEAVLESMMKRGLQHMYLITLAGTRAKELVFREESIRETIAARGGFIVEWKDTTRPDFSLEELKKEHGNDFIGRFLERMQEEPDKELAEKAVEYGLQSLLNEDLTL